MDSAQLHVPKMENQNEFDWLYLEKQTQGILDQQTTFIDSLDDFMNNFLGFDPCQTPPDNQNNHITHFEFKDFEDLSGDISSWDVNFSTFYGDFAMDNKLLDPIAENFDHFPGAIQGNFKEVKRQSGKSSKSAALELDEIQKYFGVPITKAAKELKVGVTVLKKRCRELNIMRWPHRKIKSLKSLIHNVKELGLTREIEMLEEHRRMLEKLPELELTERTKKLRQACFKANYKKRRSSSLASLAHV